MAIEHTVRAREGGTVEVSLTRASAIAVQCTECMGDQHPKDCSSPLCPLFPFRRKTLKAYRNKPISEVEEELDWLGECDD